MKDWHVDRWIRLIAGTFVLVGTILSRAHSPNWVWFPMFVGFMMVQSSFTGFCPMEYVLRALGVRSLPTACACGDQAEQPKAANF